MPMTRDEMEAIVGPLDDQFASELLSVGATSEELAQAFAWVSADEAFVNAGAHLPTGRVAELIDILQGPDYEEEPPSGPAPATGV